MSINEMIGNKRISELTEEDLESLDMQDIIKLQELRKNKVKYIYVINKISDNEYCPIKIYMSKMKQYEAIDNKKFKTKDECEKFCEDKNTEIEHTSFTIKLILRTIMLEERLRKLLFEKKQLKITSDYTIRESFGYKYMLYENEVGILKKASITEALYCGMAAIEYDKKSKKDIVKENADKQNRIMKMINTVRRDWPW